MFQCGSQMLRITSFHSGHTHSQAEGFNLTGVSSGALVFSLDTLMLPSSRFQSGSSERSGAPVFSLVTHVLPSSQCQSNLSEGSRGWVSVRLPVCSWVHGLNLLSLGCLSVSPASSPVQVALTSWRPSTVAPSPFCLSSYICVWIHVSLLHTSILSTGDVPL